MSEGLAEFLTQHQADPATLQHAVRYLVAEWSGDLPPAAMRKRLAQEANSEEALQEMLGRLKQDSSFLEAVDLAVLEAAWENEGKRELVRGAILDAKVKLPVVEVGVIAFVAMYGAYLAITGGRKRQERSIVRRPDGSYEEREITEWYGPTGPLRALAGVFRPGTETSDEAPGGHQQEDLPAGGR